MNLCITCVNNGLAAFKPWTNISTSTLCCWGGFFWHFLLMILLIFPCIFSDLQWTRPIEDTFNCRTLPPPNVSSNQSSTGSEDEWPCPCSLWMSPITPAPMQLSFPISPNRPYLPYSPLYIVLYNSFCSCCIFNIVIKMNKIKFCYFVLFKMSGKNVQN